MTGLDGKYDRKSKAESILFGADDELHLFSAQKVKDTK